MTEWILTHVTWILINLLAVLALYNLLIANKMTSKGHIFDLNQNQINMNYILHNHNRVEKMIKKVMICLENDDVDAACLLVNKINKISPMNSDVILLKNILECSITKHNQEYNETLSYQ